MITKKNIIVAFFIIKWFLYFLFSFCILCLFYIGLRSIFQRIPTEIDFAIFQSFKFINLKLQ